MVSDSNDKQFCLADLSHPTTAMMQYQLVHVTKATCDDNIYANHSRLSGLDLNKVQSTRVLSQFVHL